MNRAERRRYDRAIKHEETARRCTACGRMARMVRTAAEPGLWDIHCERCGAVVAANVRLNVPYVRKGAKV